MIDAGSSRRGVVLVSVAVALGFVLLLFWRAIFVMIAPGHAGVLYDLFRGTRLAAYGREGLHVKLPWNRMYIYDLRLQSLLLTVNALSREGMVVDIDVVVLFRANPREVALLHRGIGPDYATRTVAPLSISAVREYVAQHDSQELYTVDAESLKRDIIAATRTEMTRHHIIVDNVVLSRLALPPTVVAAIEQKLAEEQIAAAYEFRLEAEEAEAERLRIKGVGLRRYYGTVTRSLTPSLLTWRGIEATRELAESENSKTVIVGSGKNQLPLILGRDLSIGLPETPPTGAGPQPAPPRPGPPPR